MVDLDVATVVRIDPVYFRPTEVDHLLGDPSKAIRQLGWKPRHTFRELAGMMLAADLQAAGVDPRRFEKLHGFLPDAEPRRSGVLAG
jgi:hypothetical protein